MREGAAVLVISVSLLNTGLLILLKWFNCIGTRLFQPIRLLRSALDKLIAIASFIAQFLFFFQFNLRTRLKVRKVFQHDTVDIKLHICPIVEVRRTSFVFRLGMGIMHHKVVARQPCLAQAQMGALCPLCPYFLDPEDRLVKPLVELGRGFHVAVPKKDI